MPRHRIVAASPQVTQILTEIGLGTEIVGAPNGWRPKGNVDFKSVGDLLSLNFEALARLRPELVVFDDQIDHRDLKWNCDSFGFSTHTLRFSSPESLHNSLQALNQHGIAFGSMETRLGCLRSLQKVGPLKFSNFLIVVAWDPLIVFGHDTFLSSVLSKGGARNLAPRLGLFPQVNPELLIQSRPEQIFSLDPVALKGGRSAVLLAPDRFSRVSFEMISELPKLGIVLPIECHE